MSEFNEACSLAPVVHRQTIADALRRTALRLPAKTAIVCGDTQWNYAEFDALVNRLAAGLNQVGVGKGDKVAVLARNSHGFAALRFALARLGAVFVPINFMLNSDEVAYILRHAGVRTVAADSHSADVAREASALQTQVMQYIWLPSEDLTALEPGMLDFNELCACSDGLPDIALHSQDLAQIVYTSGTDAAPKGAMLTHEAVMWHYTSSVMGAEIAETDVILHALPLFHSGPLDVFFGPGVYMGSLNVITAQYTPENVLALIEKHEINSFYALPTVWIEILSSPLFDPSKLACLKKSYHGASPMPLDMLVVLLGRLPDVRMWSLYGQTEIAGLASVLGPNDQLRKLGSCGKAVPNVETRVVNEDMQDVLVGEVGEIVHRSPHLMLGYFKDPESTAASFKDDWFHSGDLAVIDDEGFLTIVDRKKDMIKTAGYNVASREVEDIIRRLPQVSDVAVIGLPDQDLMEAVTAVIVVKPAHWLNSAEVIEFCQEAMAPFKVPKRVVFTQTLPRNRRGNLLKAKLRMRYMD